MQFVLQKHSSSPFIIPYNKPVSTLYTCKVHKNLFMVTRILIPAPLPGSLQEFGSKIQLFHGVGWYAVGILYAGPLIWDIGEQPDTGVTFGEVSENE
jgi:hypothetical protein